MLVCPTFMSVRKVGIYLEKRNKGKDGVIKTK